MAPIMRKISETTVVPIGFVLVLLGGAFWLTQIYVQGNANAAAISKHEEWESKMERRIYLIMGALKVKDRDDQ